MLKYIDSKSKVVHNGMFQQFLRTSPGDLLTDVTE